MTIREAKEILDENVCVIGNYHFTEEEIEKARSIAIKSLDMWDKVIKIIDEEREFAYADFERYKVEYLGQEWEDVLDSIPQDDYRYGMERCIDIIEEYKKEIEE